MAQKLLKHFGNAYNVLSISKEELMQVNGIGEYIADQIVLIRKVNRASGTQFTGNGTAIALLRSNCKFMCCK